MNARFNACKQERTAAAGGEGSGSGLWVTPEIVLTNAHVVEKCSSIPVDKEGKGNINHSDKSGDLALLNVTGVKGRPVYFPSTSTVFQGEAVVAAGFPLTGTLTEDLNVTQGIVSALAGLGGNTKYFQITAPVQPGNGRGRLCDKTGAGIGVVTAKLNAFRLAEHTSDIAQNIKFAIRVGEVKEYLDDRGIPFKGAPSEVPDMPTQKIRTCLKIVTGASRQGATPARSGVYTNK